VATWTKNGLNLIMDGERTLCLTPVGSCLITANSKFSGLN